MPRLEWSHSSNNKMQNDDNGDRPPTTAYALPPSSENEFPHGGHPSELDLLLALARVGSHAYYAPAATVRPFHSPESSPAVEKKTLQTATRNQTHHGGADAMMVSSPSELNSTPSEQQQHNENAIDDTAKNNKCSDDDGDDTTTEREDLIKIASDDDMEETSSDEGSGVLVEKPSSSSGADIEYHHHPSNHTSITTRTSTAITTKTQAHATKTFESTSNSNTTSILAFPSTAPKLRFFTDHQSVPTQLQQLQLQAARKRHVFETNLHNLHCQTARLVAELAQEQMDCDLALRDAVETGVYRPLQQAFERWSSSSFRSSDPTTTTATHQWMRLEQRVDQLDTQMTHALHVQLPQLQQQQQRMRIKSDNEDDDDDEEEDANVPPEVAMAQEWHEEDVRNTKSEIGLARQWESLAGVWARRYQEERAARIAAVECLTAQVRDKMLQGGTEQEMMDRIASLQAAVEQESALRRAEDARLMRYLQQQCEALQLAILEAYPEK